MSTDKMKIPMKDRLQAAIDHYGVTKKGMARAVGVSEYTVAAILNGKQKSMYEDTYEKFHPWLECKAILEPEQKGRGRKIDITAT